MADDAFGRQDDDGPGSGPAGPRRLGEGVLVVLLAVLALGGTALALVREERANLDDPVQAGLRGEVDDRDARSLLRERNLRRAFAAARARMGPDEVVVDIDARPVALAVTVRDAEERQRVLGVDLAGDVVSDDRGETPAAGLDPATLDIAAVSRATVSVLRRAPTGARVVGVGARATTDADGVARIDEWTVRVEGVRIADRTWFTTPDGRRARRSDEPRASIGTDAP